MKTIIKQNISLKSCFPGQRFRAALPIKKVIIDGLYICLQEEIYKQMYISKVLNKMLVKESNVQTIRYLFHILSRQHVISVFHWMSLILITQMKPVSNKKYYFPLQDGVHTQYSIQYKCHVRRKPSVQWSLTESRGCF